MSTNNRNLANKNKYEYIQNNFTSLCDTQTFQKHHRIKSSVSQYRQQFKVYTKTTNINRVNRPYLINKRLYLASNTQEVLNQINIPITYKFSMIYSRIQFNNNNNNDGHKYQFSQWTKYNNLAGKPSPLNEPSNLPRPFTTC